MLVLLNGADSQNISDQVVSYATIIYDIRIERTTRHKLGGIPFYLNMNNL